MNRDDWDLLREGWAFEAKLAQGRDGRGEVPASFWETYSAFANTEGGVIVLGASEREDGSLEVRGIADLDKVERDLWNGLQNPQKVSANLLTQSSVTRENLEGCQLLVVRVPKAPRSQRPVHLNGSMARAYLRVHEGDRLVHPDVARRMIADSLSDRDANVLEDFTEADLDQESVRRYRALFASRRPEHPFITEDDTGFLRQVGVLKQLRGHAAAGLTLGGLLVLGRELSIRDRFPHWHLSYRELPAEIGVDRRWVDRISSDGTWNANLFEFYTRVVLKLYEGLKVPFALEDGQFRVDETPAHKAVREALVNTLIHADYEGRGGIRVLRDPAGFEFVNPGLLLVTPEQVWRGGVSEPRNPLVQRLFGFLQLGEREGSGGPTILRAWSEQHWRAPDLVEDVENSELHLNLRQLSLLPEASVHAVRAEIGGTFDGQDELGRLALVTAHAERGVTHARLAALTNAHPREVTLKLQELVRKGVLVGSGSGRARLYALVTGSTGAELQQESSEETLGGSEERSPASEESSEESAPGSERTRGWRPMADQLAKVLEFCAERWRTLPEIAAALGREPSTVRTMYLRPLLERGALLRKHPDSPRHPHQAYRAAKTDA